MTKARHISLIFSMFALFIMQTILLCRCSETEEKSLIDKDIDRAEIFISSAKTDSAILYLQHALNLTPNDDEKAEIQIDMARAYYTAGDADGAQHALNKAFEFFDNSYITDTALLHRQMTAIKLQADIYNDAKDLNNMYKEYNRIAALAQRLDDTESFIQYKLAIYQNEQRKGHFADAIEGYEQLLAICEDDPGNSQEFNVLSSLQSVFLNIGEIKESKKYIDRMCLLADNGDKDRVLCLAEYANSKAVGDTVTQKECIKMLTTIADHFSSNNKDSELLYILAQHYIDNKQYQTAEKYTGKINYNENETSSDNYVKAHLLKAQLLLANNNAKQAIEALDSINQGDLSNSDASLYNRYLSIMSDAYYNLHEYKKSFEYERQRTASSDSIQIRSISNNFAYQHFIYQRDTTILTQNAKIKADQSRIDTLNFWHQFLLSIAAILLYICIIAYLYVRLSRQHKSEKELREMKEKLQLEVMRQTTVLQRQSEELMRKNITLYNEMKYASQLQNNILPSESILDVNAISDHFILYEPSEMISGDFYWFRHVNNKLYICCGDATGHGIPGTFVAMVCCTILNELIHKRQDKSPLTIMNELDRRMHEILQNNENIHINDTVDMTMLCIDTETCETRGVMARQSAYVVRPDGSYTRYKGDMRSLGETDLAYSNREYTEVTFDIADGDCVYLASDGYESQFGSAEKRKMQRVEMINDLISVAPYPMAQQKKMLKNKFDAWKGDNDQTDDVLIIGLKIKKE